MKKSTIVILVVVSIFIFLLTVAAVFGLIWYKGDIQQIIKGVKKQNVAQIILSPQEAYFPSATDAQMDATKTVIENRLIGAGITNYKTAVDYKRKEIDIRFSWDYDDKNFDADKVIEEIAQTAEIKFCYDEDETNVILTGENVASATAQFYLSDFENKKVEPIVSFELDDEGTKLFREATEKQLENGGVISIWFNDEEIWAPKVASVISDGRVQIEGLSEDEAKVLANQINAGALPFPIKIKDKVIKKQD